MRTHLAALALHATFLLAPLAAQTSASAAIELTVQVQNNPPAVTFQWPASATANQYAVRRRAFGTMSWGNFQWVPGGGAATSWTDTTVSVGQRYEYWFTRTGSPLAQGFASVGIEAPAIEDRGIVILIVDDTHAAALQGRLERLRQDLVGDGYRVLRHDVAPSDPVVDVKALILADAAANPGEVEAVFLLGHVPVPYSGNINPDGHSNHIGAWPADVFYGELDGNWTDSTVNNTSASRAANHNVPGDGKYDQSVIPTAVELAVGRVDLANMPAFAQSELQLLEQYLDKDHDYRHKVFAVDQRALIDDNFGYFSGEAFAASGWRNFTSLVGPANTTAGDYFTTLNTTSGNGYVWSYGCGGGSYQSANGIGNTAQFASSQNRNVFTMLFGSYFGDWDSTNNFLRAPLCSGWTLANAWAGRPHWQFHAMGMGGTLGQCVRTVQNDTAAGGFFLRHVHIGLMGDPTLRQHIVAPPGALSAVANSGAADLSWTASPDPVAGYYVYRSADPNGPFTRVTAQAVTGTTFTDPAPLPGASTYMVRALALETTPTGSYWNLSQGVFADVCFAANISYGTGCYAPTPLTLSVSPLPVVTASTGTTLTYTIDNVPEAAPGSGVYFGLVAVSLQPDYAGMPLDNLGLPGCSFYVGSIDLPLAFLGNTATATTTLDLAAGIACGSRLYATAVALVTPGSLNAFGAVTSNGIESVVGPN